MAEINFFVEQTRFTLKQKAAMRNWLINSALEERKSIETLNYIFCTDAYLLTINKTFLNHSTLTDIITFSTEGMDVYSKGKASKNRVNGEIYISIERVKENAKTFSVKFDEELNRVMIHGVLHLCGYQDKSPSDAKVMREKENYYLSKISSR